MAGASSGFVVTAAGEVLDGEENKETEQTRKINRKKRKGMKEAMKATPETRPRSNAMAIGAEPPRNRSNAITKKKFKGERQTWLKVNNENTLGISYPKMKRLCKILQLKS